MTQVLIDFLTKKDGYFRIKIVTFDDFLQNAGFFCLNYDYFWFLNLFKSLRCDI